MHLNILNARSHGPQSLLLAASLFAAASQAVNICIVPNSDTGCNQALAVLCCGNVPANICCEFIGQTTERLTAGTLPQHATATAFGNVCDNTALGSCATGGDPGINCCLGTGNTPVGSGIWESGASKRRGVGPIVVGSMHPNMVNYTAGDGVYRTAAVPSGMMGVAAEAIEGKDFAKLFDSWPAWKAE